MKRIDNSLHSKLPTIVWVGPSGARAASAGTFITLSANLAYMANSTNIGAASPVAANGSDISAAYGQTEAAKALGMRPRQILRYVLLPQALRLALPPMTNDFVSLLKDSSLVSVITVIELTKEMQIAAADLRSWLIPGIACAGFYLLLSFPLSELARLLERRLGGDHRPNAL